MGKRLSHEEVRDRRNRRIQAEILRQVAAAGDNPYNVSLEEFLKNSQIGHIGQQGAVKALMTLPLQEMAHGWEG